MCRTLQNADTLVVSRRQDAAGRPGLDPSAFAADGQGPAPAAAGRVQDRRDRHGAGRARGDRRPQAGHRRHLRPVHDHDRGQVRRDAPRGPHRGRARRQRRFQRQGMLYKSGARFIVCFMRIETHSVGHI